jgi:hypothetical protein
MPGKGHKEAASGKLGLPHNQNTYDAPRYLQERIVMYLLVSESPKDFPKDKRIQTLYQVSMSVPILELKSTS